MLSVVLPTFNESKSGYLLPILTNLNELTDTEIIVVDGGSTDQTLALLNDFDVKLITLENSTRAARLNKGIDESRGEMILLHHPRSLLKVDCIMRLQALVSECRPTWGGFTHRFDFNHPLLRFTSWYSNRIRFDLRGIVYLDHCLFFDGDLKEKGMRLPDIDIFEDTELSKQLRKFAKPLRLADEAQTSAIRFQKNGVYRQALMNQCLKLGYTLKIPAKTMNRLYEKGLGLNS